MGVDICKISRMKLELAKKILSDNEMTVFDSLKLVKRKREFLAGRFAAKEAIYKAIHEVKKDVTMRQIIVLNDEWGKPLVLKPILNGYRILITISHDSEYAVAQALLEEE